MHCSKNEPASSAAHAGDRDSKRGCSYEMAARLQLSAPEVLNISSESDATKKLYVSIKK